MRYTLGEQVQVGAGGRGSKPQLLAKSSAADDGRSLLGDEPVQAGQGAGMTDVGDLRQVAFGDGSEVTREPASSGVAGRAGKRRRVAAGSQVFEIVWTAPAGGDRGGAVVVEESRQQSAVASYYFGGGQWGQQHPVDSSGEGLRSSRKQP